MSQLCSSLTCSVPLAVFIAECLSVRLLIVQCSQLVFVCMYIHVYICIYIPL